MSGISQEQAQQAVDTVRRLKGQGLDESSSPELAAAISLLRSIQAARNAKAAAMNGTTNGTADRTDAASPPLAVTPQQMALVRCQVYAYKLLSKGSPVPQNIQEACSNPELALKLFEHQQQQASKSAAAPEDDEQDYDEEIASKEGPETSAIYPYHSFVTPSQALITAMEMTSERLGNPSGFLVPTLMPRGLDPHTLREERERFIAARVRQEIRELEAKTATLDGPVKTRALIRLKMLHLLDRQKSLRDDVIRGYSPLVQLSLVGERTAFKRGRQITLRDARKTEQLERQQKAQRDEQSTTEDVSRIKMLEIHAHNLKNAQLVFRDKQVRLGRSVARFHAEAEREEQKRLEKVSKDRLKALRADDEEAYLKLIDRTKDTRITHLVQQTDQYLEKLSAAVQKQQRGSMATIQASNAVAQGGTKVDESSFGAAPVFEEEESASGKIDYYASAHKITESITKQPNMLSGGELKEYQIKGLHKLS